MMRLLFIFLIFFLTSCSNLEDTNVNNVYIKNYFSRGSIAVVNQSDKPVRKVIVVQFISRVEACSQSSGNISIPPNTLRGVQLETYKGSCYNFSKKNRTSLWRKFVKGNYVKYYIYQ
jgi:hypothetical protein